MSTRGRYAARPTGFVDGLGLPDYALIDTERGIAEQTWSGYFAEQDARAAARRRNQEKEEEDHD